MTRARYRRALDRAKRDGLVPAGKSLRHTGRSSGDLIIQLIDPANGGETEWNRIRGGAGTTCTGTAAIVDERRRDPSMVQVSEQMLPRAIAVGTAVSKSGYRLVLTRKPRNTGLFVTVDGHQYDLTVTEDQERVGNRRPRGSGAQATAIGGIRRSTSTGGPVGCDSGSHRRRTPNAPTGATRGGAGWRTGCGLLFRSWSTVHRPHTRRSAPGSTGSGSGKRNRSAGTVKSAPRGRRRWPKPEAEPSWRNATRSSAMRWNRGPRSVRSGGSVGSWRRSPAAVPILSTPSG